MKNLHDLSRHPSSYSVPIIPRPLPLEIVEGEHFVAADLLSLILDGSFLDREADNEAMGRELVITTQPTQPSSASEDSDPAPQDVGQCSPQRKHLLVSALPLCFS